MPIHGILANSASEKRSRLLVPLSTTATRIVRRPVLSRGYGVGFRAGRAGAMGVTSAGKKRSTSGRDARNDWVFVRGGGLGGAAGLGRFEFGRGGLEVEGPPVGGGGIGVESNMAVNSNRSGIGVVAALSKAGARVSFRRIGGRTSRRRRSHLMTTMRKSGSGGSLFLYLVTGL